VTGERAKILERGERGESANARRVRYAVRSFVETSIMIRRKDPEIADDRQISEVLNHLLSRVQRGRSDSTPFSWEDARELLSEVARWHLEAEGIKVAR
jgi:hypothetical protein